jgi:hypothetical protein
MEPVPYQAAEENHFYVHAATRVRSVLTASLDGAKADIKGPSLFMGKLKRPEDSINAWDLPELEKTPENPRDWKTEVYAPTITMSGAGCDDDDEDDESSDDDKEGTTTPMIPTSGAGGGGDEPANYSSTSEDEDDDDGDSMPSLEESEDEDHQTQRLGFKIVASNNGVNIRRGGPTDPAPPPTECMQRTPNPQGVSHKDKVEKEVTDALQAYVYRDWTYKDICPKAPPLDISMVQDNDERDTNYLTTSF